jgi:hypothetical protein
VSKVRTDPNPNRQSQSRELPDSRAVAAATLDLEDIGVELLLLNMNFGNMTHAEAMLSLRLFGTEVGCRRSGESG